MDEDEIQHRILHPHPHHHHHTEFSSLKPRNGNNNNHVVGSTAIAPATSVHELLECPVCTNSMYPPIHQLICSFGAYEDVVVLNLVLEILFSFHCEKHFVEDEFFELSTLTVYWYICT
ncbi:E3 ubiquitin-protein ligase sinat3-like protein [Trifolium pratense]|uniref:E3 ubiquitin-protein ligase sinat3-like protein n=1 Tax=Trifolium pratense TaxID=57577 RepID=A0A2K3PLN4_TRIPR|nr:E3 ubiquitin-protein ligase sinat3-like protein [Trifolium pratense]